MYPSTHIPQHDLVNVTGKPVSIHYEEWGTVSTYNTQRAHRHNFNEILFFNTGGGIHDIDFATWKVEHAAVHFVASENVHILIRDKHTRGSSLMFTQDVFPGELLSRLPFSQVRPIMHLSLVQMERVQIMLGLIRDALAEDIDHTNQVVRAQAQALLFYLCGIYTQEDKVAQSALPAVIVSFKQLVQQHFKAHVNVEGYAEMLHISPKHLIELCKKHTGKTPLQHIREYTVTEAKRLLYNTGLSVKEVAYELNFEDPANFSKYFKSICGYSPVEYRKEGK